jgi:SAM-dependent methyltransferase
MPFLFAATAFVSAFLLFLVQPIIAKQILPWFGGSASVWSTCLVFFQTLLLLGYGYSHWLVHGLKPRMQTMTHILLLLASCTLLPIIPAEQWKPLGEDDPTLSILAVLTMTVGLPYFILATTSPLIQAWYARTLSRIPYRLFALSNLGSLIGLLAYPFIVEPWVTTRIQSLAWSGAYIAFVLLCALSAWASRDKQDPAAQTDRESKSAAVAPSVRDRFLWLALSATGSMLLIAVSNHITQNIASIPFLWIVPLALYLMTFILCFDSTGWYRRALFLPLAAAAVVAMGATLTSLELKIAIPIHLAGLFVLCMVCHGELSLSRPAPRYLTSFFLIVSAGGVLGGFSVGIAASYLLRGYYELGLVLTMVAILVALSTRRMGKWIPVSASIVAVYAGYNCYAQIMEHAESVIAAERSFYGALRVRDYGPPDHVRTLQHGAIRHGAQINEPPSERKMPTSYYGPNSGFGIMMSVLRDRGTPLRIGVIGLGTGTTAAYGMPGDLVRFYEINPQVVDLAQQYFTYIKDSSAKIEIVLGDARLSLERENDPPLDLIAVDAFSGDSIPTHLLTKEALEVYFRRLKPDGVLLIHTTNRYLNLPPVVKVLADHLGLETAIIEHEPGDEEAARQQSDSDWVIVLRDRRMLEAAPVTSRGTPISEQPGVSLWTDSYNNLFRVLK